LNICKSEDEVACILGHELSHVICRHTGEALSDYFFQSLLIEIVSWAFSMPLDLALDLASKVILELPKSRKMETEADYIGLLMARKAGYDPTVENCNLFPFISQRELVLLDCRWALGENVPR
jgi:predicted Zn-dependent protease